MADSGVSPEVPRDADLAGDGDGGRPAAADPLPAEAPGAGAGAPGASGRLLIADDDDNVRAVLGRILSLSGYEVTTAADGQQALRSIEERRPDVLIFDLRMPRLNGPALLRELRARGLDIPAVATSGFGTLDDVVALFRLGIVDYLRKPFTRDEVLDAVRRALRRRADAA